MRQIILEVPYEWDFLLYMQIKQMMRHDWEDSLFMASRGFTIDVYYRDRIDQMADILLQLRKQGAY